MGKSDYTFRYKVRNWPEYNRALVKRGQLTLWFDTEAVAAWRHPGPFEGRGRPKVYANAAIQCALVLNSVFHLNLRTTQGFLQSIVALMALDLPVPNYSTVSRRQSGIVKLKLTAVFDAQHGGFETGWSPISWGSIAELFVNLTMPPIERVAS